MKANWQQVVNALRDTGMSEQRIAEQVGVSQPTIHRLRSGEIVDPAYTIGSKLLELYQQVFQQTIQIERRSGVDRRQGGNRRQVRDRRQADAPDCEPVE